MSHKNVLGKGVNGLYSLILLLGVLLIAAPLHAQAIQAAITTHGKVKLIRDGKTVATIEPGLFEKGWRSGTFVASKANAGDSDVREGKLTCPGGGVVKTELRCRQKGARLTLDYRFISQDKLDLNGMHVSLLFPVSTVAGGTFSVDGKRQSIPEKFGDTHLWYGQCKALEITDRLGHALGIAPAPKLSLLVQDNRKWSPVLEVRIGELNEKSWGPGQTLDVSFTISSKNGVELEYDRAVTIVKGRGWIPLEEGLDIEPGSALDFSMQGFHDAPAGKHGRVIVSPKGHFAFADKPGQAVRFYGVNLCFSANYLTHEESDRLAERLQRLGYNTIRIHHHERGLVLSGDNPWRQAKSGEDTTKLRRDKMDQLDYLVAACKKRGIYITTDLFVSRPVPAAVIWDGARGQLEMDEFKMLVPVNQRAYDNWKTFARNFLTHRNPYTKMTWAADSTIAWLSLINEGNAANFVTGLKGRTREAWTGAWNQYLKERYKSRAELEKVWGKTLSGDPSQGAVPLPIKITDDSPEVREFNFFLAQTEVAMFAKMKAFLRGDLNCDALLTNCNGWTNRVYAQNGRADYDYVDDHFYIDHPRFLLKPWQLPSHCPNQSPIVSGNLGGIGNAFVRLWGKPFTISEYNYSGPGRFRGIGGILTGCLGALQNWDGIWRFAYSHGRQEMFEPSPLHYFNLCSDPLNQAADRAAICLYLRGDMKPAPHRLGLVVPTGRKQCLEQANTGLAPGWSSLAFVAQVGTYLTAGRGKTPADIVLGQNASAVNGETILKENPYTPGAAEIILGLMRKKGWLSGNKTNLTTKVFESETGQLLLDGPRDAMVLDTPRTAGGYAPEGETITASALTIHFDRNFGTVWASSIDGQPIASSRRLILTHLTDLQNSGARFSERARQTLQSWGGLPHLVQDGAATVRLKLEHAKGAKVWELNVSGKRIRQIPSTIEDGALVIKVSISNPAGKARILYEIDMR